jgi:4-hydroxybenzoate polyprenyltransferase
LVTLTELGRLGVLSMLLQLGLALWLEPALTPFLFLAWGYLALMSQEFFVRSWLKARPFTYMWTHMLIVPLIDLYVTACDWRVAGEVTPPHGLTWFLIASFCNGLVIEIGRKIRAPQDEEVGVETYTALWGRRKAVLAWLSALSLTALSALLAAREIGFAFPIAGLLVSLVILATIIALRFLHTPVTRRAKLIETMSGLWTILMYLSVGAIPLFWQVVTKFQ